MREPGRSADVDDRRLADVAEMRDFARAQPESIVLAGGCNSVTLCAELACSTSCRKLLGKNMARSME